jgi:hypothetical protein
METARPLAPETRRRDRLWFGFRPDKPGKRPGFTDSAGEYRDTQTGWLRERDSNPQYTQRESWRPAAAARAKGREIAQCPAWPADPSFSKGLPGRTSGVATRSRHFEVIPDGRVSTR